MQTNFQFRANPSVFPKAHAAINILSEIRFFDRINDASQTSSSRTLPREPSINKNTVDRKCSFPKSNAVNQIRKNIRVDGYYIAMKNEERKPP
jgi:hypothetical protein